MGLDDRPTRVQKKDMKASKSESASSAIANERFFRFLLWAVVAAAIIASAVALFWLNATGTTLSIHLIIATIVGVSATMLVGGGLMALVFHSSRSGIDQSNGAGNDTNNNE